MSNNVDAKDFHIDPNFIEFLSDKCPKLNILTSYIELYLIFKHYNFTFDTYQRTDISNVLIFDTNITVKNTDLQFNKAQNPRSIFTNHGINLDQEFINLYNKHFSQEQITKKVIYWGNKQINPETTNNAITFNISSPIHSKIELYEKFQNFVNYINSYIDQSDIGRPVKSYVIKIETITTKSAVPNKKYVEYKNQKDALFELAKLLKDDKNKDNEISDMELRQKITEFMKLPVPLEEKKKIKTEKKVVVTEINEIYKSFDTLYLREDDKFKLKNAQKVFNIKGFKFLSNTTYIMSIKKERARNWCFTSFESEEPKFNDLLMKYLCFSPEICPETKKPHYQGFMILKNDTALKPIKKHINAQWNLRIALGTPEENRIYCGFQDYSKDGKIKLKNPLFKEFGTPPQKGQGKRNDLKLLKNDIIEGKTTVNDIILNNPTLYHQYGRTLDKIEHLKLNNTQRNSLDKIIAIWIYGTTGTQKSHLAFNDFNLKTDYILNFKDGGFWNGYTNQKKVIIDDFRGEIPFSELLTILDVHPYQVKIKGSSPIPLIANQFIITSSMHPFEIYHNSIDSLRGDNINQLLRRLTIIKMVKNGDKVDMLKETNILEEKPKISNFDENLNN